LTQASNVRVFSLKKLYHLLERGRPKVKFFTISFSVVSTRFH
jgi:hypothetical protein